MHKLIEWWPYIVKSIINYNTGIPYVVFAVLICATLLMVIVFFLTKTDIYTFFRNASSVMLIGYILLVISTTIIFRERNSEASCVLMPFNTYKSLYIKRVAQIILNVLLFVPIGIFGGGAIKRFKKVVLCGLTLTVVIELVQLVTKTGICSTDDAIHNTIGCALGYLTYLMIRNIYRISKQRLA